MAEWKYYWKEMEQLWKRLYYTTCNNFSHAFYYGVLNSFNQHDDFDARFELFDVLNLFLIKNAIRFMLSCKLKRAKGYLV